MIDEQLLSYIKSEMVRGVPIPQIKQVLLKKGWQELDVNEAIGIADPNAKPFKTSQPQNMATLQQTTTIAEPKKKSILPLILIFLIAIIMIIATAAYILIVNPLNDTSNDELDEESTESTNANNNANSNQASPGDNTQNNQTEIPPDNEAPSDSECGTDMDCFITASQTCQASSVTNTITINIFGVEQTTVSYFEIRGIQDNKCVFYIRTESIDLVFPEEVPQEIVNQQQEIYTQLEGRDGLCYWNTADLTAVLTRWKNGQLDSGTVTCDLNPDGENECTTEGGDFGPAECTGSYFSNEI